LDALHNGHFEPDFKADYLTRRTPSRTVGADRLAPAAARSIDTARREFDEARRPTEPVF